MIKTRKFLYFIGVLLCIILIIQYHPFNQISNSMELNHQRNPLTSAQYQWIQNNDFSSQQHWYYTIGEQGDNSSIDADISGGQGNFRVLGEKRIFNLYGVPNSTDSPDWYEFAKPDYYTPDNTGIDSYGCWVSHIWLEGSNQFPGVHWRKNISMGVDMSKFEITSIDLDVIFNASVRGSGDDSTGGVDVLGESYYSATYNKSQYGIGDFVTFYVMISDIGFINPLPVALNKTIDLGIDSDGVESTINNSLIHPYDDEAIITALNSAFEKDPLHSNFTITLGIDIYSEDNWGNDWDIFNYLYIKDCNLTFTYERNIEKFTSISWNQIGDAVSGENVEITDALCYFNYSISEAWPYELSPFSEMRVLINDNAYRETIQLSTMSISLQHERFEGVDFTSLFREGVNISIGFQIYIANTFRLNRTITISIDDIYLFISYIFVTPGADLSPLVLGLTAGIIGIVIAFSLYQFHFKYPPLVRKIKKLKKKVKKSKKIKPILVNKRDEIIQNNFKDQKVILDVESIKLEKIQK
ncbi:MAG: hypothetical protein ACFFDN_23150 [Candidatus Hodarchaeota archaeon]